MYTVGDADRALTEKDNVYLQCTVRFVYTVGGDSYELTEKDTIDCSPKCGFVCTVGGGVKTLTRDPFESWQRRSFIQKRLRPWCSPK